MSSLPAAAFIGAIVVLFPLPAHWRARNVATVSLIAWLFVVNIIYGVNTVVWAHSVENFVPVWCDITTKIIIGSSSALPACTLCICKHLELVASSRSVNSTHADKRRRLIFELVMCFGVPAILMALHYIVQGHRFDIVEQFGCEPATYYSLSAVFIVWFFPLLFATITMLYAAVAFHHFLRRRASFAAHLANSNSSLSANRYFRLMAMSLAEMVWGTSFTAYTLWANVSPGLEPYVSWDFVHADFSRVGQYPTIILSAEYRQQVLLLWWVLPASAYIFFLFFGIGTETIAGYRRVITWIRRTVFRQTIDPPLGSLPIPERPVHKKPASIFTSIDLSGDDQTPPSYSPPTDRKIFPSSPAKMSTWPTVIMNPTPLDDLDLPSPSAASSSLPVTPRRWSFPRSSRRWSFSGPYPSPLHPQRHPSGSVVVQVERTPRASSKSYVYPDASYPGDDAIMTTILVKSEIADMV
ncbi:Pheromone B beta 1 receptor [Sparassis crispa]|uniref:Pheromone B beta 1 receptor n=1 Tax=Sparassis crispa TaxID=139825 RepID=A0A401GYI1_9APHY|nr:Pheromone B beta 1 receptor [Sparassis crispa]GBE87044.1 Pheromone B beta 1 receptor [Sparassis crispa]